MIGLFNARPIPLAVADPIRRPVNDPGPPATAIASRLSRFRSSVRLTSSSIGINVWLCVRLKFTVYSARSIPSSMTATLAGIPELSIASSFIMIDLTSLVVSTFESVNQQQCFVLP